MSDVTIGEAYPSDIANAVFLGDRFSDLLTNPELFDRHSLDVLPSKEIDPVIECQKQILGEHFAVIVSPNKDQLDREMIILGHFPTKAQAESLRTRAAKLLDTADELVEAAACLWEAFLEHTGTEGSLGQAMEATLTHWGTSQLRITITGFAAACDSRFYAKKNAGEFDEPFDWEWCPHFLRDHLTWDEDGKILPTLKPAP